MAVKVHIGPHIVTVNQGSTCMVTDQGGEIHPESEQGVIADDTRFVSLYNIRSNGRPWTSLNASATTYLSAKIYLVNQAFSAEESEQVPKKALSLVITRMGHGGIHEDLDVTNYSLTPIRFNLEVALHSDFADLFEIKSHTFVRRAGITTEWKKDERELRTSYTHIAISIENSAIAWPNAIRRRSMPTAGSCFESRYSPAPHGMRAANTSS